MAPFDVVIAGAGPAGATAARDLARGGAHVALVDGSHPREKACGGGVTRRALELIGAAGCATGGQLIDHIVFEAGGHSARVEVASADPSAADAGLAVFPRETFDAALLRQAVDAGAQHVAARVTHLGREGGRWSIETGAGRLETPWLLGADGPAGLVRKQVFRPFERRHLSIAAGSYVDGIETGEMVIGFIDRPCGYLWSFPRPGHLAVGTCAQADETTTTEMHAVTDRWLDGYAPAAGRRRRRYAWPIPSLGSADLDAELPAGDGWMLLGDAAGLVDPITREGIFFALRSGMLAAEAMSTATPARIYTDAVRDDLHDELRRAARLKAGFFRPRFTRLLIDALNHSPAICGVMRDLIAGSQSYRGLKRRLMGTLELGLMVKVIWPHSRRARAR